MKKRWILLLVLLCAASCASAQILPPKGVNESFQDFSGIAALPAVTMCESLTGRAAPQDGAQAVYTFYNGDTFLTWERSGEWINAYYSDGADPVWVRSEYVLINPAYYAVEETTPAYAHPLLTGVRVGLLEAGETLPLIAADDVSCLVGLRGAAAWLPLPEDWQAFSPAALSSLSRASLILADPDTGRFYERTLTDAASLQQLAAMLSSTESRGTTMAGCPFGAYLQLETPSGAYCLELATDSCCIFRIWGQDYAYARNLSQSGDAPDNTALYGLFGVALWE